MANPQTLDDVAMEDEYDETADSDFDEDAPGVEGSASSSEDDDDTQPPPKQRKLQQPGVQLIQELDSGDEATIKELKKSRRRKKKNGDDDLELSGNESEGWRARTRAMRDKEKEERKRNKLATSKGSTIDVDKIWEEMNRPALVSVPALQGRSPDQPGQSTSLLDNPGSLDADKENEPVPDTEEMITIKRTYKFAGEIHTEEKIVPKDSAEAQLWLAQQQLSKAEPLAADGRVVQRPVRTFSRFDPNLSNLSAFKSSWASKNAQNAHFKGPKLNVVEKSKMDWAVHVDSEGLKDELDTHAKAKEGYLSRMDFLKDVEQRKEDDARDARSRLRDLSQPDFKASHPSPAISPITGNAFRGMQRPPTTTGTPGPQTLPLAPSSLINRNLSPNQIPAQQRSQTTSERASRPQLASSLQPTGRNREAPLHLTPVSTAQSSAPRVSSFGPSPLDNVPERLWPRVPRFSRATEATHLHLSLDDITSTRLSLDEQELLSGVAGSNNQHRLNICHGNMRKGLEERLKSLRKMMKQLPRGQIFRTGRVPPTSSPTGDSQASEREGGEPPPAALASTVAPEDEHDGESGQKQLERQDNEQGEKQEQEAPPESEQGHLAVDLGCEVQVPNTNLEEVENSKLSTMIEDSAPTPDEQAINAPTMSSELSNPPPRVPTPSTLPLDTAPLPILNSSRYDVPPSYRQRHGSATFQPRYPNSISPFANPSVQAGPRLMSRIARESQQLPGTQAMHPSYPNSSYDNPPAAPFAGDGNGVGPVHRQHNGPGVSQLRQPNMSLEYAPGSSSSTPQNRVAPGYHQSHDYWASQLRYLDLNLTYSGGPYGSVPRTRAPTLDHQSHGPQNSHPRHLRLPVNLAATGRTYEYPRHSLHSEVRRPRSSRSSTPVGSCPTISEDQVTTSQTVMAAQSTHAMQPSQRQVPYMAGTRTYPDFPRSSHPRLPESSLRAGGPNSSSNSSRLVRHQFPSRTAALPPHVEVGQISASTRQTVSQTSESIRQQNVPGISIAAVSSSQLASNTPGTSAPSPPISASSPLPELSGASLGEHPSINPRLEEEPILRPNTEEDSDIQPCFCARGMRAMVSRAVSAFQGD